MNEPSQPDTGAESSAEGNTLERALRRLANAAESFRADQSNAPHPQVALVQPVTVAEANELNAALDAACKALTP